MLMVSSLSEGRIVLRFSFCGRDWMWIVDVDDVTVTNRPDFDVGREGFSKFPPSRWEPRGSSRDYPGP